MGAAAALLLLLLSATQATAAAAAPTGELTVALSSFATEVLDPALGGHGVKFYLALMFDYLIGVTPDGRLSPELGIATAWEASPDHRRWTFTLRRDVRFHNGDALTSADVKFSILRAIGPRSTTGYAGVLRALLDRIETPAPNRSATTSSPESRSAAAPIASWSRSPARTSGWRRCRTTGGSARPDTRR